MEDPYDDAIKYFYDLLQDDTGQNDGEFMKSGRVLQQFVKRAVERAGMEMSSKEIDYVVAEMLMEEYPYFRLGKIPAPDDAQRFEKYVMRLGVNIMRKLGMLSG